MSKPRISVVVCTYNRVKFIEACLEHLNNQSLPKDQYEVILVNNNCTDGTGDVVNTFIEKHPKLNIRHVLETNQGLSFARNRGISEANSDIVFYIDDDGEATYDLLEKIAIYFEENPDVVGAGGKVIPKYETERPKWLTYHLRMMVTEIDYGDQSFKCFGKRYPPGCNMTYRKTILEKVGGFNEALKWRVDDKYIFHEVSKVSDEIYYVPDWRVDHNIDAHRVTDENFDKLSRLLGQEERIRIKSVNPSAYPIKVLEYGLKYFATYVMALKHIVGGRAIVGRYLIRFRKLALKGLLGH